MKSSQEITEYWRGQVQAYERSGVSRKKYCERKQIKIYQLDYWRRKLRRARAAEAASTTEWIPLQIQDERVGERAAGIWLRIGRVAIEVEPGFDRELLAEVLRVVGSTC